MTVECECGKKANNRMGVGPTGRRNAWMVRVDRCSCGLMYPCNPEVLTKGQTDWVRRTNARTREANQNVERNKSNQNGTTPLGQDTSTQAHYQDPKSTATW